MHALRPFNPNLMHPLRPFNRKPRFDVNDRTQTVDELRLTLKIELT